MSNLKKEIICPHCGKKLTYSMPDFPVFGKEVVSCPWSNGCNNDFTVHYNNDTNNVYVLPLWQP